MEQYILELIRDNNRVIIPNFGAFIVAKEKGFTILFNNFLSFNDGLLVDHVMKRENVDKLEATDRVNHFVEKINKTLDTTGIYKLEGLGEFTKDSTGILRFTQAEELNDEFAQTGDAEETETEELLDIEGTPEETPEEPEKKEEPAFIAPPPVETPAEEEHETVHEEPEKETKDIYKEEKAKEKVALFIVLFVLIPLIGFGIYYFFFSEPEGSSSVKAKQEVVHKPVVKPEVSPVKKQESEIVAGPESTVKKPAVKEEKVNIPVTKKPVVSSRRHFIIVGSFKEEANANKFAETMKNKGFDTPVTIPRNGMYLVGVESFPSLTQAMKRQEELLSKYKLESWILTVRP